MAACIPKVQGFLEALRFATDEEGADIVTPRNAKVQKSAELLRGLFGGAPSPNRQKGEEIIEQIASDIRGLVRMATLSGKIDEDKLWTAFHSYRQDKDRLLGLWNQLGDIVGIELDAIVIQATTEQFLIKLLRSASVESRAPAVPSRVLSMNEKRAILYAGGYVVHTMKKKIKDDKKVTDEGCYDALEGMLGDQWDTEEGGDDDFALFVKSWISQVDRGGLTILNEAAYCFFELLELFVYDELKALKNPKARIDTKDLDFLLLCCPLYPYYFVLDTVMHQTNFIHCVLRPHNDIHNIHRSQIFGSPVLSFEYCSFLSHVEPLLFCIIKDPITL